MKRFILFFFALCLAGCSTHYYLEKDNTVTIYLKLTGAESVVFASSLNRFARKKAIQIKKDTWAVTVPDDSPFTYFYIVDGKVYIPPCRLSETDDFGAENCIYVPGL